MSAGVADTRPRHARSRQHELALVVGIGKVARVDGRRWRWVVVCFAPGGLGRGGGVGAGAHLVGGDGMICYICTQARARGGMHVRMLLRAVAGIWSASWPLRSFETVSVA
jgi:hypothetical protein